MSPRAALLSSGAFCTRSGTRVMLPDWSTLVAWTHAWDAQDADLYAPGATEQSNYGVDASLRVASIKDRGSGNFPLLRDPNSFYSGVYLLPSQLPGPLFKPGVPGLYRSRPALQFDIMPNYSGASKFYSLLTPTLDFTNSATFFNTPTGYAAPYWVAILGDGQDSTLGDNGEAGPTFGKGSVLGGTDWSVACYDFGGTITFIRTAYDVNEAESVLLLYYNSGNGAGVSDSFLEVNHRRADGALIATRVYGGQENWRWKELFIGWTDPHRYWSAAGIKLGTPSEADLTAVRTWAATYLPVTGSRA